MLNLKKTIVKEKKLNGCCIINWKRAKIMWSVKKCKVGYYKQKPLWIDLILESHRKKEGLCSFETKFRVYRH